MIIRMIDLRCDGCGENYNKPKLADNERVLLAKAEQHGWEVTDDDRHLCIWCKGVSVPEEGSS